MTQELSELALENTKRLERLINDLLDLESSDSGELRLTIGRFELRQLLERNLHAVAPFAASMSVGLRLETDVERADAMVDADRFGQIVSNLLSNAIKHSRPDCDVALSLHERDDMWRVEVHNQGNPIPESFRARMFQRFAMADASDARKRGGTGLGLAIARALVERMDGRIDYTSDDSGTRFFVELPRAKPLPSRAPENSQPLGSLPHPPADS
jgi:signal transduction histidine kinase